jgi:hypothetical protein
MIFFIKKTDPIFQGLGEELTTAGSTLRIYRI